MASPKTIIRSQFPKLSAVEFKVTSNETSDYNCVGWAAEETMDRFWWPISQYYWPPGFPLDLTIENFLAVFGSFGYQSCTSLILEEGFDKVVIYIREGKPTHMARQLPNGQWTSKLGHSWDIEHKSPLGLEGQQYGNFSKVLRRPIPQPAPVP